MFELVDRVLQLLVQDDPVRNHDDAVEHAAVLPIVQRCQAVGQPADGVALSAARGVLDEVVVADSLSLRGVHQRAYGLQLMVPGEDHRLRLDPPALVVALLLALEVDEPSEQVEEAVSLEDFLPQVRRSVGAADRIRRVPGAAVAALVEGQEVRGSTRETRRHEHGFRVGREVNEGPALELEDEFSRIAILLVLPPRILHGLTRHRVLELHRGYGNAVQGQGHVKGVL